MNYRSESQAYLDDAGRLVIPADVMLEYGLKPRSQVRIEKKADGLSLGTPVTHLRKVYIEPTNRCNLECRTCIRNVWNEPLGEMNNATFARIVVGLRSFSPPPTIMFGGLGEPLSHPDIVEMVAQVKSVGATVELITNGTLLKKERSRQLIDAGLDMLWVSLDGATPESYADVRLGAALPEVLANLRDFSEARGGSYYYFFADAQAVRILKKQDVFIRTLKYMSSPLGFVSRKSLALGAFSNAVSASRVLNLVTFFSRILGSSAQHSFSNKIIEKIHCLEESLESLLVTHPTPNQRIEAILNRTYFPSHPMSTSCKTYLTVGITLFLSFLFFVMIALSLHPSGWTLILFLTCTLLSLVVLNNAHLKILKKYELRLLRDSMMACGFMVTPPKLKQDGRKLFIANHTALLPFTAGTTFLILLFRDSGFPPLIIVIALAMPFLLTQLSLSFFLTLLSWYKNNKAATLR